MCEQKLKKKKQHYREAIETYNFGILSCPTDTQILYHNGKEGNIVKDGRYSSLVEIGLEKVAVLALNPLDILGRQTTSNIKATAWNELNAHRTNLGSIRAVGKN